MALKSYVITQSCRAPIVTATGHGARPQKITFKLFNKGSIVKGELKHANNQPAFVLVNGVYVIGLNCVKELMTKEIVTGADGKTTVQDKTITAPPTKKDTMPKVKIADAVVLGLVVGGLGVYIAEKKGLIESTDNMYKIYGAIGCSALFGYIAYRLKNKNNIKNVE